MKNKIKNYKSFYIHSVFLLFQACTEKNHMYIIFINNVTK